MCGLGGLVSLAKKQVTEGEIRKLMDIVSHRGPDDEGFFLEDYIALGHRRLSILDLSKDGHQPMAAFENCIVFNGEIYNYVELRSELEQLGYSFKSNTDTEVILASYKQWGEHCLDRFNGMWSFVIYDKAKGKLFCGRDRFGVKPFYYATIGEYFAFGSEIKQFTTLPGWRAVGNKQQILNFLLYNVFDHSSETLFKDVSQLPAGCYLTFDLKTQKANVKQWYNLKDKKRGNTRYSDLNPSQFLDLLRDSIRLRLRSDVKVGSCLSGGLDSSAIVCLANEILRAAGKNEIQETVSSCFENKAFDERQYIDEVVKHTEVKSHRVFPDFNDLARTIEEITWHMDGPFASASPFAQWNVFKKAKESGLIVMLDGQGADEQLAGYQIFYEVYFSSLFRSGKFRRFFQEYRALKRRKKIRLLDVLLPIAKRYSLKIPFVKGKLPDWIRHKGKRNPFHSYRADTLADLSLQQLYVGSLPMLLHYEDRNSMAFSIESRVPFLDYRIAEFLINLPESTKLQNGETKVIMRKALDKILPDLILKRHDKMAFVTPEVIWMRENLTLVENILTNTAKMFDEIDGDELIKSFREEITNGLAAGSIYWRLMSIGVWFNVFQIENLR